MRRRRAIDWSIRNETRGFEVMKPSSDGPASTMQRSGRSATTSAEGGFTQEDRHLAEEVAPVERGALLAVDEDRGVALEDDVEARSGQPLAEDAFPFREQHLLEGVRDALELWGGEIGEQREIGDRVGDLVTIGHASLQRRARPADDATRASAVDPRHARPMTVV